MFPETAHASTPIFYFHNVKPIDFLIYSFIYLDIIKKKILVKICF